MFSIFELLTRRPAIRIVDAGAMSLGEGTDAYHRLTESGAAQVIGFEPVEAECRKLNEGARPGHVYLPHVLGDGGERTFHECNYPMTSSLFPPDSALLDLFQNLENLTRVVRTARVRTRRLDDIAEVEDCDFLKVDVQGAELDVFRGAPRLLERVVVIHTEVEFVPMYKGQPLFADVDTHLRAAGFCFHRLEGAAGRAFKPVVAGKDPNRAIGQWLWGDAVYVRDWMHLDRLTPDKLMALAVILHEVYRSYDLVHLVLDARDRRTDESLGPEYLARLTAGKSG